MSQKANYFKLGLFVIGALIAGIVVLLVIGSGRWFERKSTIETYFNESVQGLDIGSKLKYRGVVIGEVTKISFTYVVYQQDLPMAQRARFVLVESQINPRLVGGRAATGDLTTVEGAKAEVERGLRIRLTPQGITGTSFLELDYVDPPPAVLPIAWTPNNVYIPSTPSTVSQFVNAASDIIDRLHRLDIRDRGAESGAAERADHQGSRSARVPDLGMERAVRAEGHAEGDHRQAQRRGREGARRRIGTQAPARPRQRHSGQGRPRAGGARQAGGERSRPLDAADEGSLRAEVVAARERNGRGRSRWAALLFWAVRSSVPAAP